MAKVTVTDVLNDIAPGNYTVSVTLKDSAATVIVQSAETPVVVPASIEAPTVVVT